MTSMFTLFYTVILTGSINAAELHPQQQVDFLHDRSIELLGSDPDSAYRTASRAYDISKKIDYTYGEANSRFIQGFASMKQNEMSRAMIVNLKGIELVKDSKDRELKKLHIAMLANAGTILENHYHHAKAKEYYYEAEKLSKEYNIKDHLVNIHYTKRKILS